ncbi:Protein kinase PINOID [Dichanthelium oligosanthes]|uniref:non-specific serine/threonine protein kinase n=1 Tax=Dichanthelium oligosanthes TaxID=888268 RepID=A0A1E5WEL7_9POAL|nr:Protein kinase PINOID [Dichanthelium oligosanthes]
MVAAVRAAPTLAEKPPTELATMEVVPAGEERLSDAETASSTAAPNSSLSSASSAGSLPRCSSLSRLSFDCSPSAALVAAAACSPQATRPAPARASSSSRPHRSGDAAWAAIRAASTSAAAPLGPRDFKLLRRVGGGDIGTVYLCRLRFSSAAAAAASAGRADSPPCHLYAMKVVDRRVVARKKKLERAAAEKRILRALDHPFLPTLFADFDAAPHFSCVVMEFCPGGDLHSLRHRMPSRRFPLPSARFYAAEVLLALEYLHMMGIVYRDLKPENVLIRADGHIMLTDFDLSLESTSSPSLEAATDDSNDDASTSVSCFPDHLFRLKRRRRRTAKPQTTTFVAEPVDARSCSFVGTHEYVAPEVARGGPHGAAVDWWAYGVFLYELLHGRTPFAGADNESTLRNIARRPLAFPNSSGGSCGPADAAARDLIARLLAKDPNERLGSRRGAADVKAHPFFKGLNFALLRSSRPPVVPGSSPLHRSQSCHAAPVSTTAPHKKTKPTPDARFDLF